MRPHPRIRKTIKWGGLAVATLIVGTWGASGWFEVQANLGFGNSGTLRSGCAVFMRPSAPGPWRHEPNFRVACDDASFRWRMAYGDDGTFKGAVIPLWLPLLIVTLPTALAWRLDTLAARREKMHACKSCSYPRTGLAPSSPCPECGAAAPQA